LIDEAMEKDQTTDNVAVSVIIPAYSCTEYIRAALESVFAQTFTNFEIILVNDGSPDTEMLEHLIAPYRDRIIYRKQENRGLAGARNTGIRAARGTYLAFLDSDDCWPPEYLAAQIKLFEKSPSLDLVYADALHFGDAPLPRKAFMQTSAPPVSFEGLLAEGGQIIPSGTVARRQVIVDAGLFDESLRRCEDYDLWLRIALRGARIAYQPSVFALRRVHSNALTANDTKMLEAEEQVLSKFEKSPELSEETRALLLGRLASVRAYLELEKGRRQLLSGDTDRARDCLGNAYAFFRRENPRPRGMSIYLVSDSKALKFLRRAKLRVLLWGLGTAPRLTVFGAKTWGDFLQALNCLRHPLRTREPKRVTVTLAVAIALLGLACMALAKFAIPPLIASAYRGESWPIFNRMIHGQSSHSLANYLVYWDHLRRTFLLLFFVVGLLIVGIVRPEFQAAFWRPTLRSPEGSSPVVPMARQRLLAIYALLAVIVGGSLLDIIRDTEHWPFSNYPMYSGVENSFSLTMFRLFGVTQDGSEISLHNDIRYLQPFDNSRLPQAFEYVAEKHQLREAVLDCFLRYEALRRAGRHNGPQLEAMRLYRVYWVLDPLARNVDHPDHKDLFVEVRQSETTGP
jgi:glycosyltransferase involved in cell wall biosynthesis